LRRHNHLCIVGNHDMAAVGRMDTEEFNPQAAFAADWTAATLTERSRNFLLGLPDRLEAEPFTLVHGSPRSPIWEYITNARIAAANFEQFDTPACLVGHSHVPSLYIDEDGHVIGQMPGAGDRVEIGPKPVIANPGGVGQPRDGDPRAAYALYDSETHILEWRRVEYPIQVTQQRMRQFGLPVRLIDRLTYGW
ncbi:MAG TPA: metallophosphoesterase family protein, partial [Chloroflexota bacterium]|nr:metallophosphoesterase family protein [Chloroflexota bacterium]